MFMGWAGCKIGAQEAGRQPGEPTGRCGMALPVASQLYRHQCFLPPWISASSAFRGLVRAPPQPQPAPLNINTHPTIHRGVSSPPAPDGLSGDGRGPWVQGRCRFLMSCAHMDTQTSGAAMCCSGQARPGEPIRGPWAPGWGLGGVCARPTSEPG